MKKMFRRHSGWAIFIHWFNFVCWILLLTTGLGLIKNEALNPLGAWYPELLRGLAGGGGDLLLIHEIIGCMWIVAFTLYIATNWKGTVFFLREVFSVSPKRDMEWMLKKQVQMTLGGKVLTKLGFSPKLPPQGFYNMGQKAFAQAAVIGSLVIAFTGLVMIFSQTTFGAELTWLVSWSVTLHYLAAGLVFAGLLVHIYMAAISPDERPAFKSMFTGTVPEDYAKHHHELWYEQVKSESPE